MAGVIGIVGLLSLSVDSSASTMVSRAVAELLSLSSSNEIVVTLAEILA